VTQLRARREVREFDDPPTNMDGVHGRVQSIPLEILRATHEETECDDRLASGTNKSEHTPYRCRLGLSAKQDGWRGTYILPGPTP